jgi:hypothetical protein
VIGSNRIVPFVYSILESATSVQLCSSYGCSDVTTAGVVVRIFRCRVSTISFFYQSLIFMIIIVIVIVIILVVIIAFVKKIYSFFPFFLLLNNAYDIMLLLILLCYGSQASIIQLPIAKYHAECHSRVIAIFQSVYKGRSSWGRPDCGSCRYRFQ